MIEAGGRNDAHKDYATIFFNDIKGNFTLNTKLIYQNPTGTYASMGIIVRNDMEDFFSGGFTELSRAVKYGGINIWRKDLDGGGTWLQLKKEGKTFSIFQSVGGINWKQFGGEYVIPSADDVQDVGIFSNAFSTSGEKSKAIFKDLVIEKIGYEFKNYLSSIYNSEL